MLPGSPWLWLWLLEARLPAQRPEPRTAAQVASEQEAGPWQPGPRPRSWARAGGCLPAVPQPGTGSWPPTLAPLPPQYPPPPALALPSVPGPAWPYVDDVAAGVLVVVPDEEVDEDPPVELGVHGRQLPLQLPVAAWGAGPSWSRGSRGPGPAPRALGTLAWGWGGDPCAAHVWPRAGDGGGHTSPQSTELTGPGQQCVLGLPGWGCPVPAPDVGLNQRAESRAHTRSWEQGSRGLWGAGTSFLRAWRDACPPRSWRDRPGPAQAEGLGSRSPRSCPPRPPTPPVQAAGPALPTVSVHSSMATGQPPTRPKVSSSGWESRSSIMPGREGGHSPGHWCVDTDVTRPHRGAAPQPAAQPRLLPRRRQQRRDAGARGGGGGYTYRCHRTAAEGQDGPGRCRPAMARSRQGSEPPWGALGTGRGWGASPGISRELGRTWPRDKVKGGRGDGSGCGCRLAPQGTGGSQGDGGSPWIWSVAGPWASVHSVSGRNSRRWGHGVPGGDWTAGQGPWFSGRSRAKPGPAPAGSQGGTRAAGAPRSLLSRVRSKPAL